MTYLFDTSAALAHYFEEPGADRIDAILRSAEARGALSALSVFEIAQAVVHRTGDVVEGERTAEVYAGLAHEIIPVAIEIVRTALDLRKAASARIALADILIAATAAASGAIPTSPPCPPEGRRRRRSPTRLSVGHRMQRIE